MPKKLDNIEFVEQENLPLEEINLRSNEVQEILTKMPSWMIRWGNTLILLFVLLILFISWMIKYPDVLTAQAIITTNIPPENIVAKSSGKIQEIWVKDKQAVTAGQPLAIVENNANYDDIKLLKKLMNESYFSKDSIFFPMDKLPLMQLGSINTYFANFQDEYLTYKLDKQLNPLDVEKQSGVFSKAEVEKRLKELKRQKSIKNRTLYLKRKEYKRYKSLFEKGIISEMKIDQKLSEVLQQKSLIKSLDTQISQLKESLNNAQTNVDMIDVKKTQQDTRLQQKVYQSFENLRGQIDAWEKTYVLQSSIDGKVSFLNIWTNNQHVKNGDIVFSVVPNDFTHYIAKVKVPVNNSGKLKKGQKVQIKLANFPYEEFGMLAGKVDKISAMPDNKGNYYIDVNLPGKLETSYHKVIDYKQDMRGVAEIITEDLRVIERIFYQLRKLVTK
jgi:multidrug resistance efflux pump